MRTKEKDTKYGFVSACVTVCSTIRSHLLCLAFLSFCVHIRTSDSFLPDLSRHWLWCSAYFSIFFVKQRTSRRFCILLCTISIYKPCSRDLLRRASLSSFFLSWFRLAWACCLPLFCGFRASCGCHAQAPLFLCGGRFVTVFPPGVRPLLVFLFLRVYFLVEACYSGVSSCIHIAQDLTES